MLEPCLESTPVPGLVVMGRTALRIAALPTRELEQLDHRWPMGLAQLASECKARALAVAAMLGLPDDLETAHAINPSTSMPEGEWGWHYDNLGAEIVEATMIIGAAEAPGTVFDSKLQWHGSVGTLYFMAGVEHSCPTDSIHHQRLLLRWYFPPEVTASSVRPALAVLCP